MAVEEPSTLPVEMSRTVVNEHPRTRPPGPDRPRSSKRRDTADEAKSHRPEKPRRGRRSRRQGK